MSRNLSSSLQDRPEFAIQIIALQSIFAKSRIPIHCPNVQSGRQSGQHPAGTRVFISAQDVMQDGSQVVESQIQSEPAQRMM